MKKNSTVAEKKFDIGAIVLGAVGGSRGAPHPLDGVALVLSDVAEICHTDFAPRSPALCGPEEHVDVYHGNAEPLGQDGL